MHLSWSSRYHNAWPFRHFLLSPPAFLIAGFFGLVALAFLRDFLRGRL